MSPLLLSGHLQAREHRHPRGPEHDELRLLLPGLVRSGGGGGGSAELRRITRRLPMQISNQSVQFNSQVSNFICRLGEMPMKRMRTHVASVF